MTDQEKKVIEASVDLWNAFCDLPKEHPDGGDAVQQQKLKRLSKLGIVPDKFEIYER